MAPRLYTDASIRSKVGIGGFHTHNNLMYSYKILGKKDINRAELAAVYAGLLIAPNMEVLEVLSDSHTSLSLIWGHQTHTRYATLVNCIRYVAHKKFGGHVYFDKVKGHSGVPGNELAHNLARVGTEMNQVFHMPDLYEKKRGTWSRCVDDIVEENATLNGIDIREWLF